MEKVKLKDIALIYNGNSINAKEKSEKYTLKVDGRNYIGTKDIDYDGTVTYNTGVIIPYSDTKFKIAPANCIFVCSEGGSAGRKTAHITQEVCFGNKLYAIVNDKNLFVSKYVYYYTRYREFFEQFKALMSGIIGGVSSKKFGEIEIPLPSLQEQERIVTKIEELFSKLEKGVEGLNKIKEQLKIYRQAVLKEAFEGGFCAKNIHPQIVHISEVVRKDKNALKAGPFGSSLKKEMYVKSGYKIYGQEQVIGGDENIGHYYIDENKYKELISCKIAPNDILISLVGTVGKVLILSANCKPGIINPRLIKVSLDEEKMLSKYFKYYFESGYLRSLYKQKVHGATMDVLNMGMIKELPFPLYPVSEQEKIICEIESRLSVCDKIEQTVNESLQKAENLRQSILKQTFEGKLV